MSAMNPEVEHPIGFIQHQNLGMAQVKHMLLEVVDEPSRRADQYIDAALELAALLLVVGATVDDGGAQAGMLAEYFGIMMDLHRQLPRRRDDQCADGGRGPPGRRRSGEQQVVQRDQERGGLAGAGLGLAGHIPAGEGYRKRLGLDRRAVGEAGAVDAGEQRGVQPQGVKSRRSGRQVTHCVWGTMGLRNWALKMAMGSAKKVLKTGVLLRLGEKQP